MIIGIDPGPKESSYVAVVGDRIVAKFSGPNADVRTNLLDLVYAERVDPPIIVIEWITGYGLPVGQEVFETCLVVGVLQEALTYVGCTVELLPRREVKLILTGNASCLNPHVNQAVRDLFGAPGKKSAPGPTYGVKSHEWSALAVALAWRIKCEREWWKK